MGSSANRWPPSLVTTTTLLLWTLVLAMVNYVAARHHVRADLTGRRLYQLSDKTVATLRALGAGPRIDITVFAAPGGMGGGGLAQVQGELNELLERMALQCRRLHREVVDVDRDPARVQLLAQRFKLTPGNMADLREGVVVVALGDRAKLVTVADLVDYDYGAGDEPSSERTVKAFKGEQALLSALLTVTQRRSVRVCFTTGHDEARADSLDEDGYGYLGEDLKRDTYEVSTVTPSELARGHLAPCAAVVVVGPQRSFSPEESLQLDRYLSNGGKLLLLVGPVLSRGLTALQPVGLEGLAARWGARLGDSLVIDPAQTVQFLTWATTRYGDHPITRGMEERSTTWPATREVAPAPRPGLTATTLVTSSPEGWGEVGLAAVRGQAELRFDPGVDRKGPVSVAVAAEAHGSQGRGRVVAFGSSAFGANRRSPRGSAARDYNRDLFLSSMAWLTEQPALVAIGPKAPEHVKLMLTAGQLATVLVLVMGVLPFGTLTLGLLVWWRRRT
jgi:hypothetical protein